MIEMSGPARKKGVKTRMFGVLLVFVGALDFMLSWRGGFEGSGFYTFLIVSGIFLFITGVIRESMVKNDKGKQATRE